MRRSNLIKVSGTLLVTVALMFACNENGGKQEMSGEPSTTDKEAIERGAYLVKIGGCGDCHSSKTFGPNGMTETPEVLLAGYQPSDDFPIPSKEVISKGMVFNHQNTAFAGPWGISYAANLTSDATGIGNWTYEQFEMSMRRGKYKGMEEGGPLLPPMPWPNYTKMSDADIKAIYVYLKNTMPVKNIVPAPQSPEVFK